ncbi:unnamed protein product [Parnassius apollo]|uniref:NADH dehydrogenase [ubiquinone] 1 beta subcomplex subunit 4 n=1 Tax=Parnassius apollo TaxID=110799 RepID=A0A8S3WQ58_PARAO|nr:unnamed protein product [Parnassius apollo]
MAEKYGISEEQYRLIQQQASRRAELRHEFLKQRTNPWKNAAEAGYVFDPALQKFMSLKATQFDQFKPNKRNSIFGVCAIVVPMFVYGYFVWNERNDREQKIRNGELRYRDRMAFAGTNVSLSQPDITQKLTERIDDLKQRIAAWGKRIRRYTERSTRFNQNRLFQSDQKRLYESLERPMVSGTGLAPNQADTAAFWRGLWSEPVNHSEGPWTEVVASQCAGITPMDPVIITPDDVAEAVRRAPNWKSPGLDGLHHYWLKGFMKEQVDAINIQIPKNIVPLVGTTRVHQVFSNIRGQIKYRDLSCFCERGFCECLNPKLYYPIPVPKSNNTTHKVCDFDDNLSNDNFPLSHMLTSSHENDISFKDFRTSVSKNMYKRVYRSSDTSENNTDEDEQNETHNILSGLRDSEGDQSTLKQSNNVPGNYDDKLTSKVYDNLPKFDLSGHYV